MVDNQTDEIGDEGEIGATQVFPQKCQNKDCGHSLKLQTVVGCSYDWSSAYGGRDDNVYAYCSKCSFHLHSNGTLAEYY